ncbi:1-aminocyclopropane-1-carboxylate deaminase/D-cysteine desulfhydrase [Kangiella shandongensis]|uniref:1-aminocyclopropane-1-carboxylate deaminase/D-cysteine desulfhydrase n=1 Tax=Kangiella shandongensis TaxID=2763258 RepID=UPI001CC17493|nr:pyridoxal-phosphate dependent enzyme [Kangiella shandongensis]
MLTFQPSPIQSVIWPLATQSGVTVDIKRDDLLHPVVSGNKWRKLQYLLDDAQARGCARLLSMGGSWSNHLHALAYAGKKLGIETEAFVRAHPEQELTPTLRDCQRWGMTLHFKSRVEYAELRKKTRWDAWQQRFADSYWFSEGGFSLLAIQGVKDIANEVQQHYDYIFVGCGSGATLCGLVSAFPESKVVGVAAFSGAEYLTEQLQVYLPQNTNWELDTRHHCGGFAKTTDRLKHLQQELESGNRFLLDQVYNAKVFLALHDWLSEGQISSGSKVLVIHTGGLQGRQAP